MNQHEKINYVELPAKNIEATKCFFEKALAWKFVDYGPEYTAFSNHGLDGGFSKSEKSSSTDNGGSLIVFYSNSLDTTQSKIEAAGGTITKTIFEFLAGRRFHFNDANKNESAVWSDIAIKNT